MSNQEKGIGTKLEKVLLIKLDNCVGCHACELACRQEHELTFETRSKGCQISTIGPRWINHELQLDFVPSMCFQCDDPICSYFCAVKAISKREDGLVVIDNTVCKKCKLCIYGCPYGAIYYNEVQDLVFKCDLCADRILTGFEPSCVQHCPSGALRFVQYEELSEIASGEHTFRMGMVYYASSKWELENF